MLSSGFCKRVLWPLFHSTAPTTDETVAMHNYVHADTGEAHHARWCWLTYADDASQAPTLHWCRDGRGATSAAPEAGLWWGGAKTLRGKQRPDWQTGLRRMLTPCPF